MDKQLITKVKKKKIFSKLPDSLVWRVLEKNDGNVKLARAELRKFLGVFLSNKVLKGEGVEVLKSHISSKGRNYDEFYGEIFEGFGGFESVVDLGCGVNGLSYNFLKKYVGGIVYVGLEASGQVVENVNRYFDKVGLNKKCNVIDMDLFDLEEVVKIVGGAKSPRCVFMLQVIDALEALEKNYSKKLLLKLKKVLDKGDVVVISMPLKSISGRKKFEARRT